MLRNEPLEAPSAAPGSLLFFEQRLQRRQQALRNDLRAFGRRVNSILLDRAGNVNEILVDHGHKCNMVPGGKSTEDLIERLDVLGPVIGRQRYAGQQNLDVRGFERSQHLIELAPCLLERQPAKPVIAAKFNNDGPRMNAQYRRKAGDSVFGCSSAGALIDDLVVIALGVKLTLQCVRK